MAWTSVGFDGTITEIQWAGMASLLGNGYVAAGNGDCLVTAVPGARSVSVAAGSLYGDGVLSTNSGAETVAMTTPVNGQWYVIALRRTWATNTAALVAIAGATTTTTTPTAPPTSFPTLNTNVGVLTDQPIAWAWCNSANTTVVIYDIRLKAVKSLPPVVATSAERDAKFMSPTQGLQVWRDDLGAVETYYGLYNASTNPGGRDTAGWYVTDRQTGLMPVKPSVLTIATGSGSTNAIGTVSFTGATVISLDGIFTSAYSHYKIVFDLTNSSPGINLNLRMRTGSADVTSGYLAQSHRFRSDGTIQGGGGSTDKFYFGGGSSTSADMAGEASLFNPQRSLRTYFQANHVIRESDTLDYGQYNAGHMNNTTSYDGFSLIPTGGNVTGTVQVFGYNK